MPLNYDLKEKISNSKRKERVILSEPDSEHTAEAREQSLLPKNYTTSQ